MGGVVEQGAAGRGHPRRRSSRATPAPRSWPWPTPPPPGRDPRALGEVLIGRLRDAFLVGDGRARSPPARRPTSTRAAALGEELGAAGLTRALEVLGEALVELAKKPDPAHRARGRARAPLPPRCRPLARRRARAPRAARAGRGRRRRPRRPPRPPPAADAPRRRRPRAVRARRRPPARSWPGPPPGPTRRAGEEGHRVARRRARPGAGRRRRRGPAGAEPRRRRRRGARRAPDRSTSPRSRRRGRRCSTASRARPRASSATGRFIEVDGGTRGARAAKGPPADLLEQRRPGGRGRPWRPTSASRSPLRLVVDADAPPRPSAAPAARARSRRTTRSSTSTRSRTRRPAGTSVERLAEAFPGAELVEEP